MFKRMSCDSRRIYLTILHTYTYTRLVRPSHTRVRSLAQTHAASLCQTGQKLENPNRSPSAFLFRGLTSEPSHGPLRQVAHLEAARCRMVEYMTLDVADARLRRIMGHIPDSHSRVVRRRHSQQHHLFVFTVGNEDVFETGVQCRDLKFSCAMLNLPLVPCLSALKGLEASVLASLSVLTRNPSSA